MASPEMFHMGWPDGATETLGVAHQIPKPITEFQEYHVQVPGLQRSVPIVEDFPHGGTKAPLITLQSQVVRGFQHLRSHPGDPVQDHLTDTPAEIHYSHTQ